MSPQRLAWMTMLGALAIFCLLCLSAIVFARWLVFDSPTRLSVVLHVGQGTVGLWNPDQSNEQAVRATAQVEPANRLTTDNLSQGYLAFSDPYSGELLATVLLRSGSVATLGSANRPRFSLSDNPYAIHLKNLTGRVEVWVRARLDREIRIEIDGALGTVYINETGNFWIDSRPDQLQVTARVGSVTLVSSGGQAQHVAQGAEAVIRQDGPAISVGAGPIDLLPNWDFAQVAPSLIPQTNPEDTQNWPVEWSCAWYPSPEFQDAPSGAWTFGTDNGRSVIHIQRVMQPDPGPGKTGCQKSLGGEDGLDVSEYTSLRLRVTMQVSQQSLSACGMVGSECPVMLYIQYQDKDGNKYEWYHGFYVEYRPNEGGRTTCDSCLQPHEQINKDAWYSYESVNFLTDLPSDRLPAKIDLLKFYADGHQYDVMFSEVALVATAAGTPDSP